MGHHQLREQNTPLFTSPSTEGEIIENKLNQMIAIVDKAILLSIVKTDYAKLISFCNPPTSPCKFIQGYLKPLINNIKIFFSTFK